MAVTPQTEQEWQEAVDLADGLLAVVSARAYGLVAGGPEVDVDRCYSILRRGAELGFSPGEHSVQRTIADLLRQGSIHATT